MIEVLPAPTHVAAFRISGKLTAADYEQMYGEVDAKLKAHEHVGIYTDAQELSGITPRGLAKDLAFAFGRLGEFRRFPRGAVVTDRPWLRKATRSARHPAFDRAAHVREHRARGCHELGGRAA